MSYQEYILIKIDFLNINIENFKVFAKRVVMCHLAIWNSITKFGVYIIPPGNKGNVLGSELFPSEILYTLTLALRVIKAPLKYHSLYHTSRDKSEARRYFSFKKEGYNELL